MQATDVSEGLARTTTREADNLTVQTAGAATVFSTPLNYPNPFNPTTQTTTISYLLSKDTNITLKIFDLYGTLLVSQNYSAGQNGGRAGYNDAATWDGRVNGGLVGNGIYVYLLIGDGKVLQNGIGRLTVYK